MNVLWYTGGVGLDGFLSFSGIEGAAEYQANILTLAAFDGWNVTFWVAGAKPAGNFDVFVVASGHGFWQGIVLGDLANAWPDYTALQAAVGGLVFNPNKDRIVLVGDDPDWGYTNFNPGPVAFQGPQGLLRNAINWAGGGKTMGFVLLQNEPGQDYATPNGCAPPASIQVNFNVPGYTVSGNVFSTLTNIVLPSHPVAQGLADGLSLSAAPGVGYSAFDSSKWVVVMKSAVAPFLPVLMASTGPGSNSRIAVQQLAALPLPNPCCLQELVVQYGDSLYFAPDEEMTDDASD